MEYRYKVNATGMIGEFSAPLHDTFNKDIVGAIAVFVPGVEADGITLLPTIAENEAAQHRLERLAALMGRCAWDNVSPNYEQELAREQYNRVLDEQSVYEARWCND